MTALLLSGASYDNTFSTIVRVGRTAEMSVAVVGDEGAGYQPLSKHLAKARMAMGSSSKDTKVGSSEAAPTVNGKPQQTVESRSLLTSSD